jgi:hypothetical protein
MLFILHADPLFAKQRGLLQTNDVTIIYDEQLRPAVEETARIYPAIKKDLEDILKWKVSFNPTIVLVGDKDTFQKMAGNSLIVGFAVPNNELIAIDYSRMKTDPFTLEATIKHELCHLLVHKNIQDEHLPKWLDEGVAQWVSGGLADIIMDKGFVLNGAILSDRYISIKTLDRFFPGDEKRLTIAYAESKNFVEYLIRQYGIDGLLTLLSCLKDGNDIDVAIFKSFSISFDELEERWYMGLRKKATWVTVFMNNIYSILFFISALLLIYAFIRALIKKRRYDEYEEDDSEQTI